MTSSPTLPVRTVLRDQLLPPFVVRRTTSVPGPLTRNRASQVDAEGQATALTVPLPGIVLRTQLLPPSVVRRATTTSPEELPKPPTASQIDFEGQAMALRTVDVTLPVTVPPMPAGSFSLTQLTPPSVVRSRAAVAPEVAESCPMASQTDFEGQATPVISVTPEGSISPTQVLPPLVVRRATAPCPPAMHIELEGQATASTLLDAQNQATSAQELATALLGAARALGWETSPITAIHARAATAT